MRVAWTRALDIVRGRAGPPQLTSFRDSAVSSGICTALYHGYRAVPTLRLCTFVNPDMLRLCTIAPWVQLWYGYSAVPMVQSCTHARLYTSSSQASRSETPPGTPQQPSKQAAQSTAGFFATWDETAMVVRFLGVSGRGWHSIVLHVALIEC